MERGPGGEALPSEASRRGDGVPGTPGRSSVTRRPPDLNSNRPRAPAAPRAPAPDRSWAWERRRCDPVPHDPHQRVDLQGAAGLQVLQHARLVRPHPPRHGDAFLDGHAEASPERLAHGPPLSHHLRHDGVRARVASDLLQRRAGERADRVEAQVAPQLDPDLIADIAVHRRPNAGRLEQAGQPPYARTALARRFPERQPLAVLVPDLAGRDQRRRLPDHAADRPLRPDPAPLRVIRIQHRQSSVAIGAIEAVEVPPGDAVHRRDDGGLRAQQGLHGLGQGGRRMRLHRDEHIVLLAGLRRIISAARPHEQLFARRADPQPALAHRRQVRAARDQRHVHAGPMQQRPHVAADRARAVDRDPRRTTTITHAVSCPTRHANARHRDAVMSDRVSRPAQCAAACRWGPWGSHRRSESGAAP